MEINYSCAYNVITMFTEGPFIAHLYFCNEGNDKEHVRSTVKIMYKKRFQFERKKRTKEIVKKWREAEKNYKRLIVP